MLIETFIPDSDFPGSVTAYEGNLYWSNLGNKQRGTTIGTASIDGTGVNETFVSGADTPAGLTVASPS